MLDALEIVLITYNRYTYLRETLEALRGSPFAGAKITVLDNASTDATPEVCAQYESAFPRFSAHRNTINIGGNANFLRAVELSTSEFTWVLCDDDSYDFSAADEVLAALADNQHDIIVVGPLHPQGFTGGYSGGARALAEKGFWFHLSLSFFPAMIFRTALFDGDSMVRGFRTIACHYPNFPFIHHVFQSDASVFIPSQNLVRRNEVEVSVLSPLEWYNSWVTCCQQVDGRRLRLSLIDHATARRGFVRSVVFWMALERHVDQKRLVGKAINIWLSQPLERKLLMLLLMPVALVPWPLSWMVKARALVYRFMGVPDHEIPPVEVVDRDERSTDD